MLSNQGNRSEALCFIPRGRRSFGGRCEDALCGNEGCVECRIFGTESRQSVRVLRPVAILAFDALEQCRQRFELPRLEVFAFFLENG
jgi:hypothetical protein